MPTSFYLHQSAVLCMIIPKKYHLYKLDALFTWFSNTIQLKLAVFLMLYIQQLKFTNLIDGFYILEIYQILHLIYFYHCSTENWLTLWEEKPCSIPLYTLLHVCDLLCFAYYVYANAHFETFLCMKF